LHGPFPGFIVIENDGGIKWSSTECQQDPYIGVYDWHDDLLYPSNMDNAEYWDKIRTETIEKIYDTTDMALSSLVLFWTSVAKVEPFAHKFYVEESTGRKRYRSNHEQMKNTILEELIAIRQLDDGVITNGSLGDEGLKDISDQVESSKVELVYIGMSSINFGKMCLILVHWKHGIARRILPHMLFHIDPSDWEDRCSGRKLVVLG
jgi:hypothetical protein